MPQFFNDKKESTCNLREIVTWYGAVSKMAINKRKCIIFLINRYKTYGVAKQKLFQICYCGPQWGEVQREWYGMIYLIDLSPDLLYGYVNTSQREAYQCSSNPPELVCQCTFHPYLLYQSTLQKYLMKSTSCVGQQMRPDTTISQLGSSLPPK